MTAPRSKPVLLLAHLLRLVVLATIIWLVGMEHDRFLAGQSATDLTAVPMDLVQRHLPEARAIGAESAEVAGARDLVDATGQRVGTLLRTSPTGDDAIGFSGPTDVLLVCDQELRVTGVEILTSRDTRDHVEAVVRDSAFLRSLQGRPLAELAKLHPADIEPVAGATLTSLAIAEAVIRRLGGTAAVGRFAHPPALNDLQQLFPTAAAIQQDASDPCVIRVTAAAGIPLGWALRTSPAADGLIGYQGPTDAIVGFDPTGEVCGVAVLASYDNEPYVGYVRDDKAFRGVYQGMSFEELSGLPPEATGIEGVSGATMTSQAVAQGILRAARARQERLSATAERPGLKILRGMDGPQWGAIVVILMGIVTGMTRLRGTWFGRFAVPLTVLAYLGFGAGALLSQAQLWGWAQSGLPRAAPVLVALTIVAILFPMTTRRNIYCSHLCPHGAAQQLLVRLVRPRRSLPARLRPWLLALPWMLVAVAVLTAAWHLPLALVDLEPFDAYLPAVAGIAALLIFILSLVASCFVPMAYCRYGCPTGALLDQIRLHGRADRFTWRDAVLLGCLALAVAVRWWPV